MMDTIAAERTAAGRFVKSYAKPVVMEPRA